MEFSEEFVNAISNRSFCWLGQRALDCVGLDRFLNFDLIMCCDYGQDVGKILERTGAEIISIEQHTAKRDNLSNLSLSNLFKGEYEATFNRFLYSRKDKLDMLAYCSNPELDRIRSNNADFINVLASTAALKKKIDNKITLRNVLPTLGISPVPGRVGRINSLVFKELVESYGNPFVVQYPISASGIGTYIIRFESELALLAGKERYRNVIISKFIEGFSVNINMVVLDNVVLLSYPSIQLVGIEECTDLGAGYCGNDFSAMHHIPKSTLQAIFDQTIRIGGWLRQKGFRGICGIDFVADESRVYPVEINPRFQGSTQLLTQGQLISGEFPLALAHVLRYLDTSKELIEAHATVQRRDAEPVCGAQLILHNKGKGKKIIEKTLKPGTYEIEGSLIRYRHDSIFLEDCRNHNEFVVNCGVPEPGLRIEIGSPLLKIQTLREVFDVQTCLLKPWASMVCKWAYGALGLS